MFRQYVLSEAEVKNVQERLKELRHITLLNRDAMDLECNKEWYFRAKGFEEALQMLGLCRTERRM